jgi:hypothetical protein
VNFPKLTATAYDASGAIAGTATAIGSPAPGTLNIPTSDLHGFQVFVAGASSDVRFDELRFGTDRADVIQTPEPASLGLLALCSLALSRSRRRR